MQIDKNIVKAIVTLGDELQRYLAPDRGPQPLENALQWDVLLEEVRIKNPWFTPEQVQFALGKWAAHFSEEALAYWLAPYPEATGKRLRVGLISAGNIPLVGLHDLLCILATGHTAIVKCASTDTLLLPFLVRRLAATAPEIDHQVSFTQGTLGDFDAVIATGSNNTSRYFEHYFSSKPHIIRKNRNSLAVLDGSESQDQLDSLADDVFRYFGMGCRSVSKLMVPKGYDFKEVFQAFYRFRSVTDHQKYANNYDYNKAVYLMSGAPMLDNGFLLLKEDNGLGSPIGTLFYQEYESREALLAYLEHHTEDLQCVVGPSWVSASIPFGSSQEPGLADYADGVDTVDFLLKIKQN
ncbi:acyl-CoA reductase [Robiginitalea sediminis]|uniref:acyl-CoA reductase n=1 Tax=Robiginitalea sediminis TaxID=1982593 RepID=UPI000B4B2951|nr:acyl-CoA reductase [Robiginitalea sediminis]